MIFTLPKYWIPNTCASFNAKRILLTIKRSSEGRESRKVEDSNSSNLNHFKTSTCSSLTKIVNSLEVEITSLIDNSSQAKR
jgi:hypothetical protein